MASEQLGKEYTATHFLTSIKWNSMPEYGGCGSVETGIRTVTDGTPDADSFCLIQHGWYRWQEAHEFIKKGLAKGWDAYRIGTLMQFLKERGGK